MMDPCCRKAEDAAAAAAGDDEDEVMEMQMLDFMRLHFVMRRTTSAFTVRRSSPAGPRVWGRWSLQNKRDI